MSSLGEDTNPKVPQSPAWELVTYRELVVCFQIRVNSQCLHALSRSYVRQEHKQAEIEVRNWVNDDESVKEGG